MTQHCRFFRHSGSKIRYQAMTARHSDRRRVIIQGTPEIAVELRHSAQARRLNLRVSGLDGKVTLTLPCTVPLAEAMKFLRDKENWLRSAVTRTSKPVIVTAGTDLMMRGRLLSVREHSTIRHVTETNDALLVPADPAGTRTAARLAAYLKACAQAALRPASTEFAQCLGKQFTAISLRDTRSRWGSCTAQGRLMYSWRLIMAPPDVLRYVAAHEVAHLKHMDHSTAFWATVEDMMPDYQHHRAWLRRHGAGLHTYCFSARPPAENG